MIWYNYHLTMKCRSRKGMMLVMVQNCLPLPVEVHWCRWIEMQRNWAETELGWSLEHIWYLRSVVISGRHYRWPPLSMKQKGLASRSSKYIILMMYHLPPWLNEQDCHDEAVNIFDSILISCVRKKHHAGMQQQRAAEVLAAAWFSVWPSSSHTWFLSSSNCL